MITELTSFYRSYSHSKSLLYREPWYRTLPYTIPKRNGGQPEGTPSRIAIQLCMNPSGVILLDLVRPLHASQSGRLYGAVFDWMELTSAEKLEKTSVEAAEVARPGPMRAYCTFRTRYPPRFANAYCVVSLHCPGFDSPILIRGGLQLPGSPLRAKSLSAQSSSQASRARPLFLLPLA